MKSRPKKKTNEIDQTRRSPKISEGHNQPNQCQYGKRTSRAPDAIVSPHKAPIAISSRSAASRWGTHRNVSTVRSRPQDSTFSATQYHETPTAKQYQVICKRRRVTKPESPNPGN